jgi:hypothetical protein
MEEVRRETHRMWRLLTWRQVWSRVPLSSVTLQPRRVKRGSASLAMEFDLAKGIAVMATPLGRGGDQGARMKTGEHRPEFLLSSQRLEAFEL